MAWFSNLSTRSKLLLGFGLMLLFLAVIIATATSNLQAVQQAQRQIYEQEFTSAMLIRDIRSNQRASREDLLAAMMARDPAEREARLARIAKRDQENNHHFEELRARVAPGAPAFEHLREFTMVRQEFMDFRTDTIIPLIREGQMEKAHDFIFGLNEERAVRLESLAQLLVNGLMDQVESRIEFSRQRVERMLSIFAGISLLAIGTGLLLIYLMNRAISRPLNHLARTAEAIAAGDVTAAIPPEERRDEVGNLAQSFARMVVYLQGLAAAVGSIAAGDLTTRVEPQSDRDTLGKAIAGMAASLRQMTREIQESASVLAAATSEIMSSTSEVATSVSETATAVSQTTATVEQVKQTAMVSDQKAQYVSDTAQQAAQVSVDGGKAVEETITRMNLIQDQMEAIATRIVNLSEQGQAIGEIITTVNDLAERSNLLAVNAAIEAAKAGEHGRGFGVVAQEVRSLAEQSKQATSQVRTILNEIQKATGAAVLATEQGSKSVEDGVRQSERAGESIRALGASIARAAQAAAQITASSRQQFTGMEQIIIAMENIRLASEQNAAGTRQAETASHHLHELGQKLKALVDRYQV